MAQSCNSSTLGGWGDWMMRSEDRDHPGLHDKTLVSTKNIKNSPGIVAGACNSSFLGGWGRRITWTWEAEIAVNWDLATALQPGDRHSIPKNKREKKDGSICCLILNRNYFWNLKIIKYMIESFFTEMAGDVFEGCFPLCTSLRLPHPWDPFSFLHWPPFRLGPRSLYLNYQRLVT